MIGLRDFNKTYKGCSPYYKFLHFLREAKYAWQRAWKGYDDQDVVAFSLGFRDRAIGILEEKLKVCDETWFLESSQVSSDQVKEIIKTLLDHVKQSSDDYVIEQIYGKDWYEHNPKIDWGKVLSIRRKHIDQMFEMLRKYYLWL